MNLYRRLIIALGLAALGGSTALAVVMLTQWTTGLTWALLVGVLIVTAMGLSHWVLKPLRALVTDPATGQQVDIHDLIYHLENELNSLREQDSAEVQANDAQMVAQAWQQTNQALSVLFSSVTRDTLSGTAAEHFVPQLNEWIDEGLASVAAIVWHRQTTSFSTQRGCPAKAVPDELFNARRIGNQPSLQTVDGLIWAWFPIQTGQPKTASDATQPRALVLAWEQDSPPGEQVLAGFSGVAHYMGLRTRAMAMTGQNTHTDPMGDAVSIKAEFLVDTNQRLQQAMTAMSKLTTLLSQQISRSATPSTVQTSAILDKGQETLEQLIQLLDLTASNWQPSAQPAQTVSIVKLCESIAQRHHNHPGVQINTQGTHADTPVRTEPAPLSLALDTLLTEMATRYPGQISLAVQHHTKNGISHAGITIESDHTSPADSDPLASLGMALVDRLAASRGGRLVQEKNAAGQTVTLFWPYASPPTNRQNHHGKAA